MRLIVMISGSGTNLQAILDALVRGDLKVELVLVVSNRKDAYGLERARQFNIPTHYAPLKPYRDHDGEAARDRYEADLARHLQTYAPDLIVLAGWMHVLGAAFLAHFPRKVINLHPALYGEFAGTHAIQRAYEAYQRGKITRSGVMVHHVIPEVDAGEVILQAEVPMIAHESLAEFEARMHAIEHQLIVQAIQTFLA